MQIDKERISMKLMRTTIVLLFIPILCIGVGVYLFSEFHAEYIEYKYGVHSQNFNYLPDTIQVHDLATDEVMDRIREGIEENVRNMRDAVYLEELNTQLAENDSYLIVKIEEIITYIGDAQGYNVLDKSLLISQADCNPDHKFGMYVGGDSPTLIKSIDFEFQNGESASVFIIIDVSESIPEAGNYIFMIVIIITLSIILAATLVVAILWSRVLRPLIKLKEALDGVTVGDYDTEIDIDGTTEINQFANQLDELRGVLKLRRDEYNAKEKEMKEMISNISHDLKTPITSIKGYAEGLVDGIATTQERRDRYCKTILTKANQIDALIDGLSLYSQVNRKHMMYNFQNINVKNYFDDCAEELSIDLENRGVEFIYQNYVSDNISVNADSQQLERVIQNIINNSLKYVIGDKPIISLRVTDEDDAIVLRIVDNGPGIPEGDIDNIFDRFYRADQSRNSDTGGSGIGLAIVKEIVEAHGGEVWTTSKTSVGTVMNIKLVKIEDSVEE